MTIEEIRNFLDDTKVYVNGKSREIQEKLFSFGYKWNNECTDVSFTCSPFLFIYTDMSFARSGDMEYFSKYENREITAEQILALELDPSCRPFKDTEECWREMLKHKPFGWLTQKGGGYFNPKVVCDKGVMIFVDGDYFPFIHAFALFLFADGTPFGIKE